MLVELELLGRKYLGPGRQGHYVLAHINMNQCELLLQKTTDCKDHTVQPKTISYFSKSQQKTTVHNYYPDKKISYTLLRTKTGKELEVFWPEYKALVAVWKASVK